MRIFLLIFITFFSIHAEDTLLLNTHIKMVPKIMALDTRLATKISANKPILGIIYEGNRKNIAHTIANEITQQHNGKVANITFSTIVLSVDELPSRRDISFVYLTQMSTSSARKIALWGIDNNIPTFSYNASDLEEGVLGSIAIERSTIIYINKTTLKKGKFRFNDTLFQIARLIE